MRSRVEKRKMRSLLSDKEQYAIVLRVWPEEGPSEAVSAAFDEDIDVSTMLPSSVAQLLLDYVRKAIYDSARPSVEAFYQKWSPSFPAMDLQFCEEQLQAAEALATAWRVRRDSVVVP